MARLISTSCFSRRSPSLMPKIQRARRSQMRMRSIMSSIDSPRTATSKIHQRKLADEAAQFLRRHPFPFPDEFARRLDLVPHVAHHHAPHHPVALVVDYAGIVFLLPVGESFQSRITLAGRLVAELEQIREKIRLIGKGVMRAGHIPPRPFPLIEGVVPVLDTHRLSQCPVRKKGV